MLANVFVQGCNHFVACIGGIQKSRSGNVCGATCEENCKRNFCVLGGTVDAESSILEVRAIDDVTILRRLSFGTRKVKKTLGKLPALS